MGSYAPSMPTTKVYEYKGCSTCRKALKWLEAQGIEYKAVPIRETPPNKKLCFGRPGWLPPMPKQKGKG